MKNIILFCFILMTLVFTKCNKASTSDFTDTTIKEKLSNKDWKLLQSGLDTNNNSFIDEGELRYADTTSVTVNFHLNDNGTGNFSFSTPDTSGSASLTWTLDSTNTYITSNISALHLTTVSKLIDVSNMDFTIIADTSVRPYWFLHFTRL
ncbi:MAG: hypothetical protein JWN78_3214 [Bacteroidota bacterium]|nr:hypothetical protein [Bacteroidota bacterium]